LPLWTDIGKLGITVVARGRCGTGAAT
jgi:hypothetical protein